MQQEKQDTLKSFIKYFCFMSLWTQVLFVCNSSVMLKCAYNPKTTTANNNIGDCNSGNFWPLFHPDAAAADDNDDDDIMVIRMIVINDSNKEQKYCWSQ